MTLTTVAALAIAVTCHGSHQLLLWSRRKVLLMLILDVATSVVMTTLGMGGLQAVDFDDHDDDESSGLTNVAHVGRNSNQNHRPMVGGFAAAAYEAARAYHYKKQRERKQEQALCTVDISSRQICFFIQGRQ